MRDADRAIRFGTGGWRARIGEDFIADNVRRVARAVAEMIIEGGGAEAPVPIGYDRRFLSDSAARWIAEVLCASGLRVHFMNRSAPTPLIMHMVKSQGLFCGLEVTASHNPPAYNGIKLIVREGRDAPVEVTKKLEARIDALSGADVARVPFEEALSLGQIELLRKPFDAFLDDVISRLDMDAIRARGLRIAFDPMHGSGAYPLTTILYTARCTVDLIHQNKDAYFGAEMPAPSQTSLEELARKVKTGGYDLGVAFDGDGDRIGIIDAGGRYVSANEILVMLYWYLHEVKGWKGPVVRNLSTTHLLDRMAEAFGEKCYETSVGFKHISAKMDETGAVLGGESSGGLTVRGHIFGKDSIYASSLFVEMLSATKMTAGQILDMLHERFGEAAFVEEALRFAPEARPRIEQKLMCERAVPNFEGVARASYLDGCKLYFRDGGFVTCRFSGTEPLLRLMAEASTRERAQSYIDGFKEMLEGIS